MLEKIVSELRWSWYLLKIRGYRSLAEDEQSLKLCLQKCPPWLRGHYLLGNCLLKRLQLDPELCRARARRAIFLCAQAMEILRTKESQQYQAQYLRIGALFFSDNFQACREVASGLADSRNVKRALGENYWRMLDYWAAAEIMLQGYTQARQIYEQIPRGKRQASSMAGLYFTNKT